MDGSGLKELLSIIYAEYLVDKMLQSHAFNRALQAHFVVYTALSKIILDVGDISDEEKHANKLLINDVYDESPILESLDHNHQLLDLEKKQRLTFTKLDTKVLLQLYKSPWIHSAWLLESAPAMS